MQFERLFNDFKIPYDTKVNRGWINVQCTECGDKSLNLGFKINGDYAHCWRCGGKNLKYILSSVLKVSINILDSILEDYGGKETTVLKKNTFSKVKQVVLPTNTLNVDERKYLIDRKFKPSLLKTKYGVVGGGVSGLWKYRIIIPVIQKGIVTSFVARSILSNKILKMYDIPRYKNLPEEFSIKSVKETVFNLDNCKNTTGIMLEGSFDVFRFGDDSFCCLGSSLTQTQINIIANRFNKVFILFDNEKEAQIKAKKYGKLINNLGVDVEIVDCFGDFNKNDAGELNEMEVMQIRNELGV